MKELLLYRDVQWSRGGILPGSDGDGDRPREASMSEAAAVQTSRGKMCSGSEAGSYLRLIDFVYHSTCLLLSSQEKKKKRAWGGRRRRPPEGSEHVRGSRRPPPRHLSVKFGV